MTGTRFVVFPECNYGLAKGKSAGAAFWLTIFTFILVVIVFLVMVKPAWADASNVHGMFTPSTDKCGSCHRMHDPLGPKLISQPTPTGLCLSCHAKGQSADTDVLDGIYLDEKNAGHSWGAANGTLLSGGFDYVGQADPVTGRHAIELAAIPYGSETNQVFTLGCLDCHTPHQGPNYRLLRQRPGGAASNIAVTWNGPWTDASQTTQGGDYAAYTITDFDSGTAEVQGYTRNYQGGLAEWCAACHQKYMTRHDVSGYNAGDTYGAVARYRHAVNVVITGGATDPINGIAYNLTTALPLAGDKIMCLTCHAAHGSAAKMTGSAVLSAGSRGSLPGGTNSMMLRLDDRLICTACHNFKT